MRPIAVNTAGAVFFACSSLNEDFCTPAKIRRWKFSSIRALALEHHHIRENEFITVSPVKGTLEWTLEHPPDSYRDGIGCSTETSHRRLARSSTESGWERKCSERRFLAAWCANNEMFPHQKSPWIFGSTFCFKTKGGREMIEGD